MDQTEGWLLIHRGKKLCHRWPIDYGKLERNTRNAAGLGRSVQLVQEMHDNKEIAVEYVN
jgi:hypothetical protein